MARRRRGHEDKRASQPAPSGKLLAELSNLPEWQPPEPESPEQIRERLIAHLRGVIADAEAELTRLGATRTPGKR